MAVAIPCTHWTPLRSLRSSLVPRLSNVVISGSSPCSLEFFNPNWSFAFPVDSAMGGDLLSGNCLIMDNYRKLPIQHPLKSHPRRKAYCYTSKWCIIEFCCHPSGARHPSEGWWPEHWQGSINTVLDTRNGSVWNKLWLSIALHMSALCLPDVTTRPKLPGLPLPCLHTASDQRLEVGTFGNAAVICSAWIMAMAPQDSLCLSPCNFYCQMWFLQCWKSEVGFNG